MRTTGSVNIPGSLHSVATDGIVVYAGDVYDEGLLMTQKEINRFDGGISGDYSWKVLTLEQYTACLHNPKTLYFISDNALVDFSSTLSGNALLLAGTLSGNTITTYGTVSNNNITLI